MNNYDTLEDITLVSGDNTVDIVIKTNLMAVSMVVDINRIHTILTCNPISYAKNKKFIGYCIEKTTYLPPVREKRVLTIKVLLESDFSKKYHSIVLYEGYIADENQCFIDSDLRITETV